MKPGQLGRITFERVFLYNRIDRLTGSDNVGSLQRNDIVLIVHVDNTRTTHFTETRFVFVLSNDGFGWINRDSIFIIV